MNETCEDCGALFWEPWEVHEDNLWRRSGELGWTPQTDDRFTCHLCDACRQSIQAEQVALDALEGHYVSGLSIEQLDDIPFNHARDDAEQKKLTMAKRANMLRTHPAGYWRGEDLPPLT